MEANLKREDGLKLEDSGKATSAFCSAADLAKERIWEVSKLLATQVEFTNGYYNPAAGRKET